MENMENNNTLNKLKELFLRGASVPLRIMPLWMEAVGAGIFLAAVVQKNPAFKARLSELEGKIFRFEARDLDKSFYLLVKDCELLCVPHVARMPDVTMSGNFPILLDLLLGRVDPDTVFFSRKLEITGDTSAAIYFKNILASLE